MAIPRRTGVVGHVGQFFGDEIAMLDGLLLTSRTRTWLDISRRMSIDELTVVADHLIRRPRPELEGRSEAYASIGEVEKMLDRHKGTPGIRKARLALEQARVGAGSAPKTRLRLALGRAGLPEPCLNPPTELRAGVVRQPDLGYPEYRVAVEYEGDGHSEPEQIIRDIAREEDFSGAGWTLVRLSKRHMVNDARSAVAKVHAALLDRGWTPRGWTPGLTPASCTNWIAVVAVLSPENGNKCELLERGASRGRTRNNLLWRTLYGSIDAYAWKWSTLETGPKHFGERKAHHATRRIQCQ